MTPRDTQVNASRMSSPPDTSAPWTVARLLAWTRDYFERSQIESPRLCAELLLAHALGCQRLQLYTRFESVPQAAALETFRTAVREAASGRPIAYLTGSKEFFSLAFEVTPDVLIPRPETEVLVERTISLLRGASQPARVLDLCTGSGCVAVCLARHLPSANVCASDVSEAAVLVGRRNAGRHGLTDRVEFRTGDLLAPWADSTPFDVIVANPPYVALAEAAELSPTVREHEPAAALFAGADGLDYLRRIAAEARPRLAPGGHLLMEMGYRQAPAVRALLEEAGWRDIVTYRDDLRHERVVHARAAS